MWVLLFVALNIAVIAWTAYREFHVKSRPAEFTFGENGILYLAGALGCLVIIFLTETVKLLLAMHFLKGEMSFRAAFETVVLGKYYDSITPTGGGGQPLQMYWLHLNGYSAKESAGTPAAAFITRQLSAVLLALAVFIIQKEIEPEAIRYTAYAGLICCAIPPCFEIAFSLHPKAVEVLLVWLLRLGEKVHLIKDYERTLNKVLNTLTQYRDGFTLMARNKSLLTELMLLSVLCRIALCSIPFFVLRTLGCQVSYFYILCLTVYIYAAVTLIPTPGNSGVSEGAFYLVFSQVGSSGIFWAMLLWRLICYYSLLLIGLPYLGRQVEVFRQSRRQKEEDRE